MPSNAVQWLWEGLGGGRTALVVVVFAAAKDLHGFGVFFMHKVSTAVMNEAAVDGLAALAAALQVTAEPPRRLFHSVGSPPNWLDKGLPVRTWRLPGLCAKICGPYQDKSDRVGAGTAC